MTKTITLEAIDPIEIYGAGNKNGNLAGDF